MFRKIFLAILILVAGFFLVDHFWPRHLTVGIMIPQEEMEAGSYGHKVAGIGDMAGEFRGATTVLIGNNRINLPNAWTTYIVKSGYPVTVNTLELKGHYTRDEFIERWIELQKMVHELPEWHKDGYAIFDADEDINIDTIRAEANRLTDEADEWMTSPLAERTRRLTLIDGWYRIDIKGRVFFSRLWINYTYDKRRPKTPYRFSFHEGLSAYSVNCLEDFDRFYENPMTEEEFAAQTKSNGGHPFYNPVLRDLFAGWDRADTSPETVRPILDHYIFELCKQEETDWSWFR